MQVAIWSSAVTGYNMSNPVVSSHLRTSKPTRPQNSFPKDTASLQTKIQRPVSRKGSIL